MSMEGKSQVSVAERRIFALSLVVLGILLSLLIWFRPGGLTVIACASAVAWGASMLFNTDEPIERRWVGVVVPLVASVLGGVVYLVESPAIIAMMAGAALVVIGVVVWLRERFAGSLYETWGQLFHPLAWSVSTLLLILVYYVVVTPIGLGSRLTGRDPMSRTFDRDAISYWVKRDQANDSDRYFRQF